MFRAAFSEPETVYCIHRLLPSAIYFPISYTHSHGQIVYGGLCERFRYSQCIENISFQEFMPSFRKHHAQPMLECFSFRSLDMIRSISYCNLWISIYSFYITYYYMVSFFMFRSHFMRPEKRVFLGIHLCRFGTNSLPSAKSMTIIMVLLI